MTTKIEREYGPCYACDGTGHPRGSTNPVLIALSIGTSLDRVARNCEICKGTGRVVTKEIEIKE